MKKVGSCLVALVLALGSSVAVAAPGHGDRDHKGAKHHRGSKDFNVGRHHIVPRIEHASHSKSKHKAKQRAKQHRKHVRNHRQYKAEKQHRRQHRKHDGWRNNRWDHNKHFNKRARNNYWKHNGWRYNHWNRDWRHSRHYSRNRHYGNYLGAAIIGSALTYSLYHLHDGAVCYGSHEDHRDHDYERNDVVGCHRIERLEDGSQVRVDVPLSECH